MAELQGRGDSDENHTDRDGTVEEVLVKPADQIDAKDLLVTLTLD